MVHCAMKTLQKSSFASICGTLKSSLYFTAQTYPVSMTGFFFSLQTCPPSFPLPLLPFSLLNPRSLSQLLCAVESDPQARGISVQLFQGAADTHKVGWCAIQHPSSSFSSHSQWQSFVRMLCCVLWTKTFWGNLAGSGQPFKGGKDAKTGVLEKESAGGERGVLVLCRLHP